MGCIKDVTAMLIKYKQQQTLAKHLGCKLAFDVDMSKIFWPQLSVETLVNLVVFFHEWGPVMVLTRLYLRLRKQGQCRRT